MAADKMALDVGLRSKWYVENKDRDIYTMSLKDIDRSEQWVKHVESFIDIVLKEGKFIKLFEEHSLDRENLIDIFLLMTIATLPNPIFKTGRSKLGHTLVGAAMYQEINKQLKAFLNSLGFEHESDWEQKQFGHRLATEVVTFAKFLKKAHISAYGEITLKEI